MIRKGFFITTTAILILAVFAGIVSAFDTQPVAVVKANLDNVRAYAAASQNAGLSYAVDGGELFAGRPGEWRKVATPDGVIVSTVIADSTRPGLLYVGAANELAVYRMESQGGWMRVALSDDYVGGVTSLALDKANHLLYVGTDTAGIFRLRDVGSSMIAGGHTEVSEPVLEIATDSTGAGLVFARTPSTLYRGESLGMTWSEIDNLHSAPTAVAIVNGYPATVYVGTTDRGLLTSQDGVNWNLTNDGLNFVPGSRLSVDAIAVDPAQLDVLYVATSYRFGDTQVHQSPVGVSQSTNGGATWQTLEAVTEAPVAALLPVTGQSGAVYALTMASRQPMALGTAPALVESQEALAAAATSTSNVPWTTLVAWIVAGLAAIALLYALATDLGAQPKPAKGPLAVRRQSISHQ